MTTEKKRAHHGSLPIQQYADLMEMKTLALDKGVPELSQWADHAAAIRQDLERRIDELERENRLLSREIAELREQE